MAHKIGVYPRFDCDPDEMMADLITAVTYFTGRKDVDFRNNANGLMFEASGYVPNSLLMFLNERYDLHID